jgi:glycosyltransferase involved in cell wall biosynthesis
VEINVLMHGVQSSGLGVMARGLAKLLLDMGHRTQSAQSDGDHARGWRLSPADLTVLCLPPLLLDQMDLFPQMGRTVGYWSWETDKTPPRWVHAIEQYGISELWVPSTWCKDAARRGGIKVPVKVVPHYVEVPKLMSVEGGPTFLYCFDATSVIERKNPSALIEAFRKVHAKNKDVTLAIKINRAALAKDKVRDVMWPAKGLPVTFITDERSRSETLALIASCQVYVSPSRAEAFGLSIAEAALLGKPVVCPDYSGPADFVDPEFACSHRVVKVPEDVEVYGGIGRWADVSTDELARQMLRGIGGKLDNEHARYRLSKERITQAVQESIEEQMVHV